MLIRSIRFASRALGTAVAVGTLAASTVAADQVSWATDNDGSWFDPTNWSTQMVPGAVDDVLIDRANAMPNMTFNTTGESDINGLVLSDPLTIQHGMLGVATTLQLNSTLLVNETANSASTAGLKNATIVGSASGQLQLGNSVLDHVTLGANATVIGGHSLVVRNGLTLNNSTVEVQSGSHVFLGSPATLSGTGVIHIQDQASSIEGEATIGPNVTIHGGGAIFPNQTLINQGTIIGDDPFTGLLIDSSAGTFINQGLIDAKPHGFVGFYLGPTWQNTGTIRTTGGSLTFSGGIPLVNAGTISYEAAGQSYDLTQTVTNSGTLRAANGCSLEANVNNSGTIVADGGAMTLFSYTNTGHISAINGGSIELRLAPDSGNISADGATLILDGAFTTAQLRAVSLTNATVALNITATMNNTGDTLTLADNTLSFTGTIEPGLTGGAVTGGAIVTTGSGRVVVPSGKTGALNGVLLNGALAMQGGTLNVTNGLTLDSSRLSGTGTIDLIGSADDNFLKPIGTSLAVPQGLTIRADSGASLGTSEGTLINSGTLSAQGAGKTFNVLGFVTNNGTVEARNGATLTIASPQQLSNLAGSTLTGGSWSAYAGSTLNLPSASIKTNNSANILLDGSGSSFPAIAALAINEGTFSVNHGASFITAGGLANTGTLSMAQGTFTVPGTLTNSGTITLDRSSLTVAALDGQGGQITLATDPASGKALNIGSPSGASAYGGKISGAGTLLKSGASVQTLSGANSIGTVNVSGGMIDFGATQQAKQLIIGAGAAAALTPGGGKALSVNSLSVAGAPGNWTGVLDLDDGSLNISYGLDSPRATIASLLVSGYAGGTWTGPGIHSSQAANDPVHAALGYADGTDGIVPRLLAGGLLVKYTHPGDANLDGAVNFTDLLDLAQRYGRSGSWDTGDFNYDGTVGFDDLLALAQNYGASPTAAELARLTPETRASVMSAFAAVPEPGAFGLTCLVALGLGGRRRLANRAAAAIIRPSSSEAVESACNRSV